MKRFFEWLIDLNDIRLGHDAPLSVHWDLPVPAWLLLAVLLITTTAVALVYRREQASVVRRTVLLALRLSLVALLIAALCHPSLVLQRNRVEPAQIALIVDQSLSMSVQDSYDDSTKSEIAEAIGAPDPQQVARQSRLSIAVEALVRNGQSAIRQLLRNNGVNLITFASATEQIASQRKGESPEPIATALQSLVPDGLASDLSGALDAVLRHGQGQRLAAIVLLSDGRLTSAGRLEELLSESANRQVPIYPLRIGSTSREIDLEVRSVKAQGVVFANDILLVEASISAEGIDKPTECSVSLWDEQTGELVDEKKVTVDPSGHPAVVELSAKPAREGNARYQVRVEPAPGERLLENNQDIVDTRVLADRLKVLYVESYPRFEYRYVKNALLREKSIELSVLLLEADSNFVQEGVEPIRRFPETAEELSRFHVILFGDVDPNEGWLTSGQMNALLEFVGQRGGGFGLLAGERYAPFRFAGTPLERIIPVNIDPQAPGLKSTPQLKGFKPQMTAAGSESRVLRFFSNPEENEQAIDAFPELFWEARSLGNKPGTTVLLEDPLQSTATGANPLIVLGRYGAGKIFFQATDDTWRWRKHTGELLYDGYWVRVMRELMNSSFSSSDRRFVIRTDRHTYPYGVPVRIQLEILDPRLMTEDQTGIALRVAHLPTTSQDGQPGNSAAEGDFVAQRLGPQSNIFEANFLPSASGTLTVTAPELPAAGGGRGTSAVFRVEKPDLEMRHRDADHQTLARIAAATGGKMLEWNELESQFGEIRDRSVQIPDDIVEPLWDSRLVFLLFVLMISMEWGLRKAFGLL